ncbi:MAG: hypothetical protein GY811_10910, partial [Myxococcales bacterium]|nr:hypothetical protein [Myxococcales bacterium]
LEALLALPLAALAHADGGVDELMAEPLLLLEALRETGSQFHVFVDEAGIAIPRTGRGTYAMLESSVHAVRATNGGAFHPKVWVMRFVGEDDAPLLRVAVLSRNLTFDCSWDVALVSEAVPEGKRRKRSSRPLGDLLRALPGLANQALPEGLEPRVEQLAAEVERCEFPSPETFEGAIDFQTLGLKQSRGKRLWLPAEHGSRLLAISPFISARALEALAGASYGKCILIGRQDQLDSLPEKAISDWDRVLVLAEQAGSEIDDEAADRPDGLHAKVIGIEHGWNVSWYVGSANITNSGFGGYNVELMASVTGKCSRFGIDRFAAAGFIDICESYQPIEPAVIDSEAVFAKDALEKVRQALLADGALHVECAHDDSGWLLTLKGNLELSADIKVVAWPVSLGEESGKPLPLPLGWQLPTNLLTAFVAFRLSSIVAGVDDVRLALLLPATGMPENRMMHVLRSLIDSRERFMRFLRALIGGLDGLVEWSGQGNGDETSGWGAAFGGESLLEDLMRIAAREPARLEPVRRLIDDLRATDEGRDIVPDDLIAVWDAVQEAIDHHSVRGHDTNATAHVDLCATPAAEAD